MADRNVVDARQHSGAEIRDQGRIARQIGAEIGDGVDTKREEARFFVERQLRQCEIVAAVRIAQKMLGASRHPFDRAPQPFCRNRRERVFPIGEQLGAETAADVRRDHPHPRGRDFQDVLAQHVADGVAALAG